MQEKEVLLQSGLDGWGNCRQPSLVVNLQQQNRFLFKLTFNGPVLSSRVRQSNAL